MSSQLTKIRRSTRRFKSQLKKQSPVQGNRSRLEQRRFEDDEQRIGLHNVDQFIW